MNDKLVEFNYYSEVIGTGRSLGTVSPFQIISGPTTSLFYDLRGTAIFTSNPSLVMGTLDRWRLDEKDQLPLNRDQWHIFSTGTANLVRIMEVEKALIPHHWANKLPDDESDYPIWIKQLINDKIHQ